MMHCLVFGETLTIDDISVYLDESEPISIMLYRLLATEFRFLRRGGATGDGIFTS